MSNNFDPRIFSTLNTQKNPHQSSSSTAKEECAPFDTIFGVSEIKRLIPEFNPSKFKYVYANEWIDKIETIGKLHKWDHSRLLLYATMRLGGIARTWFEYSLECIKNWDSFKCELLNNFPRTVDAAYVHARLQARIRSPNESVEKYVHNTVKMAKKIKLEDEKIVEYLIQGVLSPNHQMVLSTLGIDSPSEFLQFYQNLEEDCSTVSYTNLDRCHEGINIQQNRLNVNQRSIAPGSNWHQNQLPATENQQKQTPWNRRECPGRPPASNNPSTSHTAGFYTRRSSPPLRSSQQDTTTPNQFNVSKPSDNINFTILKKKSEVTQLKRNRSPEVAKNTSASKRVNDQMCYKCNPIGHHIAFNCSEASKSTEVNQEHPVNKTSKEEEANEGEKVSQGASSTVMQDPKKLKKNGTDLKSASTSKYQHENKMDVYAKMIEDLKVFTMDKPWLADVQTKDKKTLLIQKILDGRLRGNHMENQVKKLFQLVNGAVYHFKQDGLFYYLPMPQLKLVIMYCHQVIGHKGAQETLRHIEKIFWVPSIRVQVKKYVEKCTQCNPSVQNRKQQKVLNNPRRPLFIMVIGFCGPYERTDRNNSYIFIMVDLFSKYVMLRPAIAPIASVAIKALTEVSQNLVTPSIVISKDGQPFIGEQFINYCNENGIEHNATQYKQKENYELLQFIEDNVKVMMMLRGSQNWDQKLDLVRCKPIEKASNKVLGKVCKTGSISPLEIILEYKPEPSIAEKLYNTLNRNPLPMVIKIEELNEDIEDGVPVQIKSYNVNDVVVVRYSVPRTTANGASVKILPNYRGPYYVKQVLDDGKYVVSDTSFTNSEAFLKICSAKLMKGWVNRTVLMRMQFRNC